MSETYSDLVVPRRLLLGPGPSMADPRVLRAMATPLVGQFDPACTALMNEIMELSRLLFQTRNPSTFPVSGTGRAGLEAALCSLVEPGDRVVVAECGRFGLLFREIAERCGAEVTSVQAEWGRIVEPGAIRRALAAARPKVLAVVHGETSTGVLQPLEEIAGICREHDALLVADAVVTAGGCEVETDGWGIDVCVAGSQKCLSCPAGMAPLTFNSRAEAAMRRRTRKIQSNYLDLLQLQRYWSPERFNHHTVPTSMIYGLREGLRAVQVEGLRARFARHRENGRALAAGVRAMGLTLFGFEPEEHRLPMITPVVVPPGVNDVMVRHLLLRDFGIEIGAAFGPLQGKIWRIGTLGYSSQRENVLVFLPAFERVLAQAGFRVPPGSGVEAAMEIYRPSPPREQLADENIGAPGIGKF